ncbi:hypothetical protein ANN_09257 [Periplaneta americana]|uniref:Uncharacterized protein n=1 Tax=Periplaneta americana TaxID=6978 RepID=A0ABQ8TKV9_PERAM|nr:hypothetical protein ANN_09257 [Periplaneta americana]
MAADGDCHHLCKLMAPVRHRWSINDSIGEIRNTCTDASNYQAVSFTQAHRARLPYHCPPTAVHCELERYSSVLITVEKAAVGGYILNTLSRGQLSDNMTIPGYRSIGVPPIRNHHCSNMKAQVSIILGYAIERQLAKRHGGWKSNTVAEEILRHHMMMEEWNREKFSPVPGFEPRFSALCADGLSTKPHRISLFRPHLWSNGLRLWPRNQVAWVRFPVGAIVFFLVLEDILSNVTVGRKEGRKAPNAV